MMDIMGDRVASAQYIGNSSTTG